MMISLEAGSPTLFSLGKSKTSEFVVVAARINHKITRVSNVETDLWAAVLHDNDVK